VTGWRRLVWVLVGCLVAALALAADPPSPGDAPGDPHAGIEDPRRLEALAADAFEAGDEADAVRLLRLMLQRQEVARYLDYRAILRDALVLERIGRVEEAAQNYRASFDDDVHRTIQVLRIMSVHPEREALVQEAYDHVRGLVAALKRGETAKIYTTSKGSARNLTELTTAQVVSNARAGKPSRYCYVEFLDLTGLQDPPSSIRLDRCVVGRILVPNLELGAFVFRGIALDDVDLGKTWTGKRNKGKTIPASSVDDLMFRDAVFVKRANFSGVTVRGDGRAYFPMAVFEDVADFKGAEFFGVTEFRFASFGAGANFRLLRMHAPVYFGASRYRSDTVFTGIYSERDVYFNSATFEGAVSFDHCEFSRGATFEDAQFLGPANFGTTRVVENLNLSRAVFHDVVNVKDVELGELDAFGAHLMADAWFTDAMIKGRTRFSLDEVTRHAVREHIDKLLPLYRHYQGDEDADAPLTTQSSYGVEAIDDLSTRIDGDISFANTVFGGYTVFEGVKFGREGEQPTVASFFNSQFLGETHFERTRWFAQADFTTIFGNEVAFNAARFERSLILDDANVTGRITLTDASFAEEADLSFYGAEIKSFQIQPGHVVKSNGDHRLFYERCAQDGPDRQDVRIRRFASPEDSDLDLRVQCYDYVIDEFIALKDSYGDRAMTGAEDEAYWWTRHHQAMAKLRHGSWFQKVKTLIIDLALFELCFGWGVRLGNLGIAVVFVTLAFAVLYRVFCPSTILAYDGRDIPIREVPFWGLVFVSLQSLIAINTGWDFGEDDHRFRWLNTIETVIGFIILTFFVGAYTRMILA
jgi:hypothetical protein